MDKKEVIRDIVERGIENVIPSKDALVELLSSGKQLNIYIGIDPTATRIHLGHAVPLRKLNKLANLGHKVTFLIGDFTAKIGDTSDKESERPVLTDEEIANNFETYKKQAEKVLDFSKVKVVHNSEWLSKLGFADVLKIASNFSVNDFISRELVRKRLDEGKRVSLPETLYPLMQGYDSYHMDTDVQLGGTDQTFNMQAGRTLMKALRGKESFVLANGFLPGTDGRKMSKTWDNAIWLEDSPQDIYGKVMSVSDDVMYDYWIYGTDVPLEEVEEKMKRIEGGENPMNVKKELAAQIVKELWGEEQVGPSAEYFEKTIVKKEAAEDVQSFSYRATSLPTVSLPQEMVGWGTASSNSEARRLLDQGAVYVNDQRVDPQAKEIELKKGENLVRVGKRRYVKVVSEDL